MVPPAQTGTSGDLVSAADRDELSGDPKGYFVLVQQKSAAEEEIDLQELLQRVWRGRWWLLAAIIACGGFAAFNAFRTAPVYRSEILLTVRSDLQGSSSLLRGQLGGLASLAGLNIGGAGDRRNEFVAYLKSRALAQAFIDTQQLMPVLFESQWDATTKQLRPDQKGRMPTIEDGVAYVQGLRKVTEEVKTGLITVSFEWVDPEVAARWANAYVAVANEKLRQDAIKDAELSIKYLDDELTRARVESVRLSLYRLMEGRINEVMLANVEHEYAFKTIDRARVPDVRRPVRPKRTLEIMIGLVAGGILGVAFVLWRYAPARKAQPPSRS